MVKVVLKKSHVDKAGKCPVVIQVNHNYKTKRRTLFKIDPKHWDGREVKKTHPDHVQLNRKIRKAINDFEGRIKELEDAGRPFNVQDVFRAKKQATTLSDAIRAYADGQRNMNRHANARKHQNVADRVDQFDPGVSLTSINTRWMDEFQAFIRSIDSVSSEATVARHMKFLKTVLRYEFSEGRFFDQRAIMYRVSVPRTVKERLSRDEFARWCDADIPEDLRLYRDFFAAMVYLRGLRVSDALRLSRDNLIGDKIRVEEEKTGKIQDIRILPPLRTIIDRYAGQSKHYLFPILKQVPVNPKINQRYQKHIEAKTSLLNKNYKLIAAHCQIRKKVTNHIARHTFTTFADRSGLDTRTISKMLNHSSIRVTEAYLGDLRRSDELDDAADKVFTQGI